MPVVQLPHAGIAGMLSFNQRGGRDAEHVDRSEVANYSAVEVQFCLEIMQICEVASVRWVQVAKQGRFAARMLKTRSDMLGAE